MRRVVGLTLAGLGAFLIIVAVLLPTYVVGQVVKFPLNEYEYATLVGHGVSYFSPTKVKELTGITMRATYTIKGDGKAGTSSTAVWNEFSDEYDLTNRTPFQYQTRRFAFDRRTAQLADCCGANVNGDKSIRQAGLIGYVWPIGTERKTYYVFDIVLERPMPFRYEGTATTLGIPTYLFVERVAATPAAKLTVPGFLVGMSQKSVTLPEYYTGLIKYWVDPTTGALVNVNEYEKLTLDNASGTKVLAQLYNGDLAVTPASLRYVVGLDSSGRNQLSLLTTILPLTFGIAGAIAVIAGIVLRRAGREEDQPGSADITAPERIAYPVHRPAQDQAPTAQFPAVAAQDPAPATRDPVPPAQNQPGTPQDPATTA